MEFRSLMERRATEQIADLLRGSKDKVAAAQDLREQQESASTARFLAARECKRRGLGFTG